MDFQGKTVIVTGGTRGIGKAISTAFLKANAEKVIATYQSNETSANSFKEEMKEFGDRLETVKFDVSSYEEVETFFGNLGETPVHILINNGGIRKDSIVGMMKPEDWQKVLQVNLSGTFHMSKFAVHKMMQNRWGRIINIISPSGELGFEGQANYAASKAGTVGFSRSLSKEVAKRKITVNCVSPGFIDTDLISDLPEEQKKEYKKMVPMKRFGLPEEVAHSVLFLASENASYITGTELKVAGGL